jgi:RimJ/RimL family protein N-acetyltransferase
MDNYEKNIRTKISDYKNKYFDNPDLYSIPIIFNDEKVGRLRPVPNKIIGAAVNDVALQTKWRNLHKDSFLVEPFVATEERTLNWLNETYFNYDERILFIVEDSNRKPIGHLGLENFEYTKKSCEYGRLMRGDFSDLEGLKKINLIEKAQISFLNWGFNFLGIEIIHGTLFKENYMVRRLHDKCGFNVINEFIIHKISGEKKVLEIELTKKEYNNKFNNKIT